MKNVILHTRTQRVKGAPIVDEYSVIGQEYKPDFKKTSFEKEKLKEMKSTYKQNKKMGLR